MDILQLILPSMVFDHFTCVHYEIQPKQIDIYLDEKLVRPEESNKKYTSKGFTDYSIIQDFPLRGKAVFLHVRRRKWQDEITGKVITTNLAISHIGTQISEEFATFLKRTQ